MNKREKEIHDIYVKLVKLMDKTPVTIQQAEGLRRAAMTLHRWYENECDGTIQRDEDTGVCHWYNADTGNRCGIALDREKGAEKAIAKICTALGLHYYLQTDPRGGTLYVDVQPIPSNNYSRSTFIA